MNKVEDIENKLKGITTSLALTGVHTMVETSTSGDWLHVVVACNEFEALTQTQRESMIWKEFEKNFDDSTLLSISQCYLLSASEFADLSKDDKIAR